MSEFASSKETNKKLPPPDDRADKLAPEYEPIVLDEESVAVDTPEPRRTTLLLERRYLLEFGEPVPELYLSYETEEEYQQIIQKHLEQGVPVDTRPGPNDIMASDQV